MLLSRGDTGGNCVTSLARTDAVASDDAWINQRRSTGTGLSGTAFNSFAVQNTQYLTGYWNQQQRQQLLPSSRIAGKDFASAAV